MTTDRPAQPRVRGNDWPGLTPPSVGEWQPSKSVSVVIPAHQAGRTLPYTLASLVAQTYPAHLLEVVVVDDGSEPPLELPSRRPENTRVVRTEGSWGRAYACHTGALAASGDVLHWLDADMLLHRDEVEAQMRWHHLLDYAVVLGQKRFVDVADGLPDLDATVAAVDRGQAGDLFADRWTSDHDWVEEHLEKTGQLTRNPTRSYLVHVGASASLHRSLYLDTGGMNAALKLGEDIEIGYRLAQQGAVFVPDREARSWHLGRTTLMQQQDEVNRYNRPYVTDLISDLRHWRTKGRSYSVPWVEVVVDARDRTFEEVRHSVNGALTGSFSDVAVVLLGGWSRLDDSRRSPLGDPDRDLRMVAAEFAGDARVRFVEEVPATAFPAAFRLRLAAGWAPERESVARLAREAAKEDRGLVSLLMPDGGVSALERTSAFTRAERVRRQGEDLLDAVDDVSKTWWLDAAEEGFVHVDDPEASVSAPYKPEKPGRAGRGAGSRAGVTRTDDSGLTPDEAPPSDTAAGGVRRLLSRGARRGKPDA